MLGIVTAIEFDLVHQPRFYGGSLWFDGADAADRHRALAGLVRRSCPRRAPRRSRCSSCPTCQGVPPMLAGRLTLSVRYVWTGDADEGERWFAAMRAAAPVILDDVADKPYTAIDSVHTDPLDPTPALRGGPRAHRLPARRPRTRCSR